MLSVRTPCNSDTCRVREEGGADFLPGLGSIRASQWFAWIVAGLAIAFSLWFPTTALVVSPWVFFSALIILGMPHGMIDALILLSPKYATATFGKGNQWKYLSAYVGLSAVYAAVWYFFPALGIGSFLLLTAWHWGSSEFGQVKTRSVLWVLLGFTRGLVVVSALFVFHGVDSNAAATQCGLVIPEFVGQLGFIAAISTHLFALLLAGRGGSSGMVRYLVEFAIVVALLAIAPLYLGVGIYYMCFHALRFFEWFPKKNRLDLANRGKLIIETHLICALIALGFAVIYLAIKVDTDIATWATNSVPIHLQLLAILTLPHAVLCYRFQRGDNEWVSPRSLIRFFCTATSEERRGR